jgi:hypothetical protein
MLRYCPSREKEWIAKATPRRSIAAERATAKIAPYGKPAVESQQNLRRLMRASTNLTTAACMPN